jgi:hypothetical protein
VIRESARLVAPELMEAEVSDLIGARRGERTEDRVTHRNGIGRGGGHAGVPGPLRPSLGGRLCPTVIAASARRRRAPARSPNEASDILQWAIR